MLLHWLQRPVSSLLLPLFLSPLPPSAPFLSCSLTLPSLHFALFFLSHFEAGSHVSSMDCMCGGWLHIHCIVKDICLLYLTSVGMTGMCYHKPARFFTGELWRVERNQFALVANIGHQELFSKLHLAPLYQPKVYFCWYPLYRREYKWQNYYLTVWAVLTCSQPL